MHGVLKGGSRPIGYFRLLALLVTFAALFTWSFPAGAAADSKPNDFFARVAKKSPYGLYPRSFLGRQVYWTIVGVDGGGGHTALFSEDGAVEPQKGGFSVQPFLLTAGHLLTWANVVSTQSLLDGYLPIPEVTWKARGWKIRIRAFGSGGRVDSWLHVDYTVENLTGHARKATLALALRPFEVDPPTQFLNTKGGFSPIYKIESSGDEIRVNDAASLFALETPDKFIASGFASGDVISRPQAVKRLQDKAGALKAEDPSGYASGAMLFSLALKPHEKQTVHLLAHLSGNAKIPEAARREPGGWTAREQRAVASRWRSKLNGVSILAPPAAQPLINTLRSSLAYILISRNGPALQPGTRSYARTWIRDAAMMSEALLRMGKDNVVRDFLNWYAPFQFPGGKAPCCVDGRGADPAPENDSQGEFIFTVAQYYRYTYDRAQLENLWPHVASAVGYMDLLRARERTQANQSPDRLCDFDLMPASISHEGYCKKPMHSYWDDLWSLKGYDDALYLARILGKSDEAKRIEASRDTFRKDLIASIRRAAARHKVDYIPGCAELGDFDPTSTTVAMSPTGESRYLPKSLLKDTFELYWHHFLARRDSKGSWKDYTPYELRLVDVFIRLGRPERAMALLDFFMKDRRPAAWNGWAEVVRPGIRTPGFIGDMPHAWIGSDFVRSVLDMFAYRRNKAMVLGAGIPASWLEAQGSGLSGLRTPWGRLSFSLRSTKKFVRLKIDCDSVPPGGFIVPWPYANPAGAINSGGAKVYFRGSKLHIDSAHANVTVGRTYAGRG
jgi:hypothetical protein